MAIAEYVAGSVQHFAVQMNERAAELGCLDTHFVTPNGLDKSDEGGAHQTTAYDLSRIMAACIQNDKFLKITQTVSKTISSIDGTFQATLNNHNALLSMVEGVISGKPVLQRRRDIAMWEHIEKRIVHIPLRCWPVAGRTTKAISGRMQEN